MIIKNIQQRFISDDIGYGQFATTFIPQGTLIWHNSGDYKIIPKTNFDELTTEEQEQALKYGIQNLFLNLFCNFIKITKTVFYCLQIRL